MATEFITTNQTTTYTIDSGDEIFLLPDVTMTSTFRIFNFSENSPGDVTGTYNIYLSGDVFSGDDLVSQTFRAPDASGSPILDVDLFFTIAEGSTLMANGDGFVMAASDPDIDLARVSIQNAGFISVAEAVLFASGFDSVEFVNTGTVQQSGNSSLQQQALFDNIAEVEAKITNHGIMTAAGEAEIVDTFMGLNATLEFRNTGLVSVQGPTAFLINGNTGAVFDFVNTGDVYGDMESSVNNQFGNDGNYYGQLYLSGDFNEVVNNGLIADDITVTGSGSLSVVNAGNIFGQVTGGGGFNNIANLGSILGGYLGGSNSDYVVNNGFMGGADLGSGDDFYLGTGELFSGVFGGGGNDMIYTGNFDDYIEGGDNNDLIRSRDGDDQLFAGNGNDTVFGGMGDDTILGEGGSDIILGGRGNDDIVGDLGRDEIFGGSGDDTMTGDIGTDTLYGGSGEDLLFGGDQGDLLFGGSGIDTLDGGTGDDVLHSGSGDDILIGGAGADVFDFGRNSGNDVITDFEDGSDILDLTAFDIASLTELRAAGMNTENGYFIDLDLLGGQGSILIEGVIMNQITTLDYIA